jgi:hypothetical protein
MHDHDDLDLLLRSALSTYGDPDSGLTRRVLARVSAEVAPAPSRRWLFWSLALPAAACLLLFVVLSSPKPTHQPSGLVRQTFPFQDLPRITTHTEPSRAPQPAVALRSKATLLKPRPHRIAAGAKPAPLPKLDVFPTPRPLTPEERALVIFAAQTPEAERKDLIEAQKQFDAPLSIAAIQIPPLEPPQEGKN